MRSVTKDLLLEIAHCPNVRHCVETGDREHPCWGVVSHQEGGLSERVNPEPWRGRIERARILFLSSNPSIGGGEYAPRWYWPDEDLIDVYQNAFGGGKKQWIKDGIRVLMEDGTHRKKPTQFWIAVRARAAELLAVPIPEVRPGEDYAITEIVHCCSRSEDGVADALEECANRYLECVLAVSGARVIVCLGGFVHKAIRPRFDVPGNANVHGPLQIGGKERMLAFLPHPNAWEKKTFTAVCGEGELDRLRTLLAAKA